MKKYYVYYLLDPSKFYLPFYVGTGKRAHHLTDLLKNTDNPRKKAVISKIRAIGEEPKILIVKYFDSAKEAYAFEASEIGKFGRRGIDDGGILTNLTSDSRPPSKLGIPMSEETKEKIRLANTGKKRSAEICAKLSEQRKGRKHAPPTEETKEKIRQSNTGITKRKWTEEERAIHSARVKLQWSKPERRLKQEAAFRERRTKKPD